MAITPAQIAQAQAKQIAAAEDIATTIRLVAGPGSGKSKAIERRVQWLIANQGILPSEIVALSFTRAASQDLKNRIYNYCVGVPHITDLKVSTLHSLALYVLKRTNNLTAYPTDPVILDDWELKNIIDLEFSKTLGCSPTRSKEIRSEHEAFWSTNNWSPPTQQVVNPPVTLAERNSFTPYHNNRTQLYSCVLPGEIVRTCVDLIKAGHVDPVQVLNLRHLIVDEVQDLNPSDFEFIDSLIAAGVSVFICGDDDQSVYSFRHAFPEGIQNFNVRYPHATNHVLDDCFRCTSSVLGAADNLITSFAAINRIPKNLTSLYINSNPANQGFTRGFIFNSPLQEARYIAESCRDLIAAGIPSREIMILIGNKQQQQQTIVAELTRLNIAFDANQKDEFKESNHGRFLMSILRLIADPDDYIAYRTLLGVLTGVGIVTIKGIADKTVVNGLNFKNLFLSPLPNNVFTAGETKAISRVSAIVQAITPFTITETINQRLGDLDGLVLSNFTAQQVTEWNDAIANLPVDMTLGELKEYLQTNSVEHRDNILASLSLRLGIPVPAQVSERVRIISFHSSKGLDAKIVFIPGLEEDVFPTAKSKMSPGLISENARLMYVAITRAKAACILSYTRWRSMFGTNTAMAPSRFAINTQIVFGQQANGRLTVGEIGQIQSSINDL